MLPIDPKARVETLMTKGDQVVAEIALDAADDAVAEPEVVAFMRIGMLHRFQFQPE